MITLNNKKFAENENEFTESLFHSGGTCVGFAKRLKRQVQLFDIHNKQIAAINKHGVLCCASFPKSLKGKKWWSFADIDIIGNYGLVEQNEDIEQIKTNRDNTGYYFK